MPSFQAEAILKAPPYSKNVNVTVTPSGTAHRVQVDTIGAASNAYAVLPSPIVFPPNGAYFTFVADTDCYIHWGPSTNINSASASASAFLPAGVYVEFWLRPLLEDAFAVIQKTTGGNIYRWMSNH